MYEPYFSYAEKQSVDVICEACVEEQYETLLYALPVACPRPCEPYSLLHIDTLQFTCLLEHRKKFYKPEKRRRWMVL